jgi:hypothetical protein
VKASANQMAVEALEGRERVHVVKSRFTDPATGMETQDMMPDDGRAGAASYAHHFGVLGQS